MRVVALQLKNKPDYQKNLDELIEAIKNESKDALIVAPEVCLTDYDYDNLQSAADFGKKALHRLLEVVDKEIVVLTLILQEGEHFVNKAVVINRGKIVHSQNKYKLFKLGNEHHYLRAGDGKDIKIFEIDNIKYGLLICFELRYKELWQKLEGADIILAPSQWGEPRKRHLEIIPNALAVINQCYVVVANSSKEGMASSSAIYAPMGGVTIDDASSKIVSEIDLKQVKFMRRYIKL